MERIKAVIIEDNLSWLEEFKLILTESFSQEIELLGDADSVTGAQTLIEKTRPDLLFLDIQLLDGTSFDLLDKLRKPYPFRQLIYITQFSDQLPIAVDKSGAYFLAFIEKDLNNFEQKLKEKINSYQNHLKSQDFFYMPDLRRLSNDFLKPALAPHPQQSFENLQQILEDIIGKNDYLAFWHKNKAVKIPLGQILAFERGKRNGVEKTVISTYDSNQDLLEVNWYEEQVYDKYEKLFLRPKFFKYRERIKGDHRSGFLHMKYIEKVEKFKDGKNLQMWVKMKGEETPKVIPSKKNASFIKWYFS